MMDGGCKEVKAKMLRWDKKDNNMQTNTFRHKGFLFSVFLA